MSVLLGVVVNLVSAAIGGLAVLAYDRYVKNRRTQVLRWLWSPYGGRHAQIVVGRRSRLVEDEMFEGFMSESDALAIGTLTSFLSDIYDSVGVVSDTSEIDWSQTVIAVGGPVVNELAQRLNASTDVPYRFEEPELRDIVSTDQTQRFAASARSEAAYSLLTVLQARQRRKEALVLVIAGSFGPETLAAVSELSNPRLVRQLKSSIGDSDVEQFQAVLKVSGSLEAGTDDVSLVGFAALEPVAALAVQDLGDDSAK